MSRNLSGNADLAQKYAVGEIVDMAGVPTFYDAGTSKWMQGNTWYPRTQVGDAVADLLSQNPSNGSLAPTGREQFVPSYATDCFSPPAVLGNVAVFSNNSSGNLLVLEDDNFRYIAPPWTASYAGRVISDGTYFWGICLSFATKVWRSTNGLDWTELAASGRPSITQGSYSLWPTGDSSSLSSTPSYGKFSYFGYYAGVGSQYYGSIIEWLGARLLAIGNDSTNVIATRSSSITSYTGDETSTIFGASKTLSSYGALIHKGTGLKAYICTQTGSVTERNRFTSDGGASFGASSGYAYQYSPTGDAYVPNTTNRDKFIITEDPTTFIVTTDCGVNLTLRTFPANRNAVYGIAYAGSTVVTAGEAGFARSTDDGATWTNFALPAGITGQIMGIWHDGYRFYTATSANGFITSTDGITWTIRQFPSNFNLSANVSIAAFDSNTPVFCIGSYLLYSLDAGVTWKVMTIGMSTDNYGQYMRVVTTGATQWLVGYSLRRTQQQGFLLTKADLQTGAQYVRATSSTLSAIRPGSIPMIRAA